MSSSQENYPIDQKTLWDKQHYARRAEHREMAATPNSFAVGCVGYLNDGDRVLEFGSASGRDARFFTRKKNCSVVAIDFSQNALGHLKEDAAEDGSIDFMQPLAADIKKFPLKNRKGPVFNAIYSRSSLHISDHDLDLLLAQSLEMLKPGGYLMIEGKTPRDPKIKSSAEVADNLVIDGGGHLRRVWNKEYIIEQIIKKFGLKLILMNFSSGKTLDRGSAYINFIAQKQ